MRADRRRSGPDSPAVGSSAGVSAGRRPKPRQAGGSRSRPRWFTGRIEYDYAAERARMVEEQLARRGIGDQRVLDAMRRVPRHLFVEATAAPYAYEDHPMPIGDGQTISQ